MAGRGRGRGRGLVSVKPTAPGGGNDVDVKDNKDFIIDRTKMKNVDRCKIYREKRREDAERLARAQALDRARSRAHRLKKKENQEDIDRTRELARIRQRRYREKKKDENKTEKTMKVKTRQKKEKEAARRENDRLAVQKQKTTKVKTRQEKEAARRENDRLAMQKQKTTKGKTRQEKEAARRENVRLAMQKHRAKMHAQKRRRINEKRRENYRKLKVQKRAQFDQKVGKASQADLQFVQSAAPYPTQNAYKRAVLQTGMEEVPVKKDARVEQALKDLEAEIDSLNFDPSDQDLHRIEQLAVVVMAANENVQTVARMLYNQVLKSRDLAKAGALVVDRLAAMDKEGNNFRSAVLSLVQVDYKGREELQKKSRSRYLSFLSFLSQLFGTMRLATGEVMQPLVNPIYDCCDLVLESDPIDSDECECVLQQVQQVGRELQDNGEERMQHFMELVRSKIISEKSKPQVRCFLMELLEYYLRRWQNAPNDVTRFYCDMTVDIMSNLVLDE